MACEGVVSFIDHDLAPQNQANCDPNGQHSLEPSSLSFPPGVRGVLDILAMNTAGHPSVQTSLQLTMLLVESFHLEEETGIDEVKK